MIQQKSGRLVLASLMAAGVVGYAGAEDQPAARPAAAEPATLTDHNVVWTAPGTDHGGLVAYWPFEILEQSEDRVLTGDQVEMPFAGLLTEHQWNSDSRKWQNFGLGKPSAPEPFGEQTGKPTIPLLHWSHVAGTFDPSAGLTIYLNGKRLNAVGVQGESSLRQVWLLGMTTDHSAGELAPLARSWSHAPAISVRSGGLSSGTYSLAQRCFEFICREPVTQPVEIDIAAGDDSPVVNIPLVLQNN